MCTYASYRGIGLMLSITWLAAGAFGLAPELAKDTQVATLPAALQRCIDSRMRLRTGSFDVKIRTTGAGGERVRNAQARFAGNHALWTDLGDDQGIVERDESGQPADTCRQTPRHWLRSDDHVWSIEVDANSAQLYPSGSGYAGPDFRALGLVPGLPGQNLGELLREYQSSPNRPVVYSEKQEADQTVVTARSPEGSVTTWWISEKHGHQPVRVTCSAGGTIVAECRVELAEFDGQVYPKRVTYTAGAAGTVPPYYEYDILSARFNDPADPADITPESIGIRPHETMIFSYHADGGLLHAGPSGYFDGQRFVPLSEYYARLRDKRAASLAAAGPAKAGTAGATPMATPANASNAPVDSSKATSATSSIHDLTKWEDYTRQFIRDHKLDAGQQNAALAILKQCQERGGKYVESHKDEIDKLDAELRDLKAAKSEPAKPLTERSAELQKRRSALTRPLDEIFEKDLKPRLEKLLTEKQRRVQP